MGFSTRAVAFFASLVAAALFFPLAASANGPEGSVGVVDTTTGIWYLRDPVSGETTSFYYGNPGDFPVIGDWDCDGDETPGLYRQSDGFVYLRNSNTQGVADIRFFFGNPGDIPIVGDFNGDGCDTVSIYRPGEGRVYIINRLGTNEGGLGAADFAYYFGNPGDKPFVGDFDNDGVDEVGLHRESTGLIYFRYTHTEGVADVSFIYGAPGDKIIAANWAQTGALGPDTVGILRPSNGTVYLRFSNTQGVADEEIQYGNANMLPVAGDFGPLPGGSMPPPHPVERISSFTTFFDCCQNRVTNIRLIAAEVNGTVVMPGETFSVDAITGPRTSSGGYLPAPYMQDGEGECCAVGGGVSQFGTTIFNAVFWAGLDVISYRPHSGWISRYPLGIEHTLVYSSIDFRFRNDTSRPITIRTSSTSTSVTVEIWGNQGGWQMTGYHPRGARSSSITVLDSGGPSAKRVSAAVFGSAPGLVRVVRTLTESGSSSSESWWWNYVS